MEIGRRTLLTGAAALAAASAARGQPAPSRPFDPNEPDLPPWPARERFPLWPGEPPGGATRPIEPRPEITDFGGGRQEVVLRGVAIPEVHVFRPAFPDGSALLSIPGGSYESLWVKNEGIDVAQFFNGKRTTVFVLTYRLPGEGWTLRAVAPLQDAQRAMRLIRSRAAEFRIDPARLGAIGFSAGGHLAADLAVSHGEEVYAPVDAADRLSARPAYLGLIYPVTTLVSVNVNGRNWEALTGPAPQAELEARSPLLHIADDTPPSFLAQAMDDGLINPANTVEWASRLRSHGIGAEVHLFEKGGHGFGLRLPPGNPGSLWPELFARWMRQNGG